MEVELSKKSIKVAIELTKVLNGYMKTNEPELLLPRGAARMLGISISRLYHIN